MVHLQKLYYYGKITYYIWYHYLWNGVEVYDEKREEESGRCV